MPFVLADGKDALGFLSDLLQDMHFSTKTEHRHTDVLIAELGERFRDVSLQRVRPLELTECLRRDSRRKTYRIDGGQRAVQDDDLAGAIRRCMSEIVKQDRTLLRLDRFVSFVRLCVPIWIGLVGWPTEALPWVCLSGRSTRFA